MEASDLEWCYVMLDKTSRSFAAVIRALGDDLRDAVCIFYLTLRALDTVEDDTSFDKQRKLPLLREFYKKLYIRGWNFSECGSGNDLELISHLERMINVFLQLKPEFQTVIADITRRMGEGMAEFIDLREVYSVADWDHYCHYVAGLVGIGLSGLFAASGQEDPEFANMERLSNIMGLFLQKTNIIRDYREDIEEQRVFWPRQIWSQYASKLEDFKDPKNAQQAVFCLNHLIGNALSHIPDCLEYMAKLRDPNNFNFCAIPQVMAIATLAECYNNHAVFMGVVKISREDTMKIIGSLNGIQSVYVWFYRYINRIIAKVPANDPNRQQILSSLASTKKLIESKVSDASKLLVAKL